MADLYDRMRAEGLCDPVLVRASIACQVGKECPFPTIKAMADHYGIHPEQLRMYIKGLRPMEPRLEAAFGLERVTFYRPSRSLPLSDSLTNGGSSNV